MVHQWMVPKVTVGSWGAGPYSNVQMNPGGVWLNGDIEPVIYSSCRAPQDAARAIRGLLSGLELDNRVDYNCGRLASGVSKDDLLPDSTHIQFELGLLNVLTSSTPPAYGRKPESWQEPLIGTLFRRGGDFSVHGVRQFLIGEAPVTDCRATYRWSLSSIGGIYDVKMDTDDPDAVMDLTIGDSASGALTASTLFDLAGCGMHLAMKNDEAPGMDHHQDSLGSIPLTGSLSAIGRKGGLANYSVHLLFFPKVSALHVRTMDPRIQIAIGYFSEPYQFESSPMRGRYEVLHLEQGAYQYLKLTGLQGEENLILLEFSGDEG